MTFSTSAKPLNYYVSGDLIDRFTDRYGCYFEEMQRKEKQLFRAALATYIVIAPEWDELANGISCADCCIAGARGDDFNVWENDPELCEWIAKCCDQLSENEIEGLINAMSAQLQGES